MSYDVFLSYRRKDPEGHSNVGTVRTFKYEFERHHYEVFFDYNDCTDEYFKDSILPAIRTCRHFVLVLTRGCFDRCKDEGDWLRREIEEAIKCGRKIIPITPDGEVDVWPTGLPESISNALTGNDGLQITTIHTDSIFEANMAQLIKDRFGQPQKRNTDEMANYPKLKVRSNLDCVMYVDDEERANIQADRLEKVPLKAGEYMLRFESTENSQDVVEDDPFSMPDRDTRYNVDLLTQKQERERKEQERKEREERKRKERERKEREARGEFEVNGVEFKMVKVEGGRFVMGATAEQGDDAFEVEKPAHWVELDGYRIGETVVTQELWMAVMKKEPTENGGWTDERGRGADYPAYNVSYNDIKTGFLPELKKRLKEETGIDYDFRLPTEAEWEYAARGGHKKGKRFKFSGSDNIGEVAWYSKNSGGKTHPVKGKKANELGLYDMSGNVWEWCEDWYGRDYYSKSPVPNPKGPGMGVFRVLRGGIWDSVAGVCRVSYRCHGQPNYRCSEIGFRLVLCP